MTIPCIRLPAGDFTFAPVQGFLVQGYECARQTTEPPPPEMRAVTASPPALQVVQLGHDGPLPLARLRALHQPGGRAAHRARHRGRRAGRGAPAAVQEVGPPGVWMDGAPRSPPRDPVPGGGSIRERRSSAPPTSSTARSPPHSAAAATRTAAAVWDAPWNTMTHEERWCGRCSRERRPGPGPPTPIPAAIPIPIPGGLSRRLARSVPRVVPGDRRGGHVRFVGWRSAPTAAPRDARIRKKNTPYPPSPSAPPPPHPPHHLCMDAWETARIVDAKILKTHRRG